METLPKLTPTQALLLRAAARRADGRVIPPANLRGGARVKAMTALMRREWIEGGDGGFVLTDAGYAVAGRKRPSPPEAEGIQEMDTPDDLQLLEGIPGGLPRVIKEHLADCGERHSKLKTGRGPELRLMPGTVLVREWDAREYRVKVTDDGRYELDGQSYKSLSAVARAITGAHWSGPAFFGLKGTRK